MASELLENTIATLRVLRTSDHGAFLDGQTGNTNDDILLHKDQQTSPVAIGDDVEVFLYRDPKGRLTASMRLPAMKVGQIGYVEVINVTNFGCFVEVGTERGIFMPHVVGQQVNGAIYNLTSDGAFFITPERWIAFLHRSEMTRKLNVGEMVEARVTFKREDGRINVSMRPIKEKALISDGQIIMEYLLQRGGKMPYSDESSAMLIKDKFNISKAAFKRALGHLMKSRLVVQEDGWTLLTEHGKQWTPNQQED